ncbi:MAG TPA: hypothetical protein VG963_24130 [Polyangiaceae bacterium]|nr:hypothetical protein [Polyangiaceae bacterium]
MLPELSAPEALHWPSEKCEKLRTETRAIKDALRDPGSLVAAEKNTRA